LQGLIRTYQIIDAINRKVGLTVAWLALGMVLVQFTVVLSRYVFAVGSIPTQETIWYMHGMLFMLGAGYTLLRDGHVRVDVFYRDASVKRRALVDLFGVIFFLVPVCGFIFYSSTDYVINSWKVLEGSTETNGIPAIFALKTVILVATVLLLLQAVSMGIRSFIALSGLEMPPIENPDETGEISASARANRNIVITIAIFLATVEFFTFVFGLSVTGVTLGVVRVVILAAALYYAFLGSNAGRVTAIIALFAAAVMTYYFTGAVAGEVAGVMVLLVYGDIVCALSLAMLPWANRPDDRDARELARERGFVVVIGIVIYVLSTEAVWFLDTLLVTAKHIAFTELPKWTVPAIIRTMLVTLLLASFYRGSRVGRVLLVLLLVAAFVYAILQAAMTGLLPLVGFSSTAIGGVIVGVLHLAVAVLVARSSSVTHFLTAQRTSGLEVVRASPEPQQS
jgi:TRAP-type mannitol/chloroaromatic compound transport system permease small subunit